MAQARPKRQRAPVKTVTVGTGVSDELWAVLAPVLPVHENRHRCGGGKPYTPARQCADAICYG